MCTFADDYARDAESGRKPPFESPHLDFLEHLKKSSVAYFLTLGGIFRAACLQNETAPEKNF